MTPRRRLSARLTRAALVRARKREAREQVAMAATIDRNALDRLGIVMGTHRDGRVLMSRADWARAREAGAVTLSP